MSLGQVGFRLELPDLNLYIDPYLSNSVQEEEGNNLARLVEIPVDPASIEDAEFVLLTHAHRDHCDVKTLRPIYVASPQSKFMGPRSVLDVLRKEGFKENRLLSLESEGVALSAGCTVRAVQSAHPECSGHSPQEWNAAGYLIESAGRRLYHSGDTSVTEQYLEGITSVRPVDVAFLPVNEHNFVRERAGIVGNMSPRDAFWLAEWLGVSVLVATHWDMFAPNQVFPAELEVLFEKLSPPFELRLVRAGLEIEV
jgi:L-ascorbate 6-phosphate lactonase